MLTNINVPYALGKHAVSGSTVDIIGPPENVLRASVAISVDWLSSEDQRKFSSAALLLLLVQILPEWKEGGEWLIANLTDIAESDEDTLSYEKIIDGRKVSLHAERLIVGTDLTLTVEGIETGSADVSQPVIDADTTLTEYLTIITSPMTKIQTTFEGLEKLFKNPQFSDSRWRADVELNLRAMQEVHSEFKAIQSIPQNATELHSTLLSATADCDAMTKPVREGLDTMSADKLQEGIPLLQSCDSKIKQATTILKRLLGQ